jgi:hypothetical protein
MRKLLFAMLFAFALCCTAEAQTPTSALPSGTPVSTDTVPYVVMAASPKVLKKTTIADFFSVLVPSFVGSSAKNGNGSKFQLFTGSFTTNHCPKFDSSGNLVDNGGTCADAAPVQSVFGRVGAVLPATNDYNFNQLAGSISTSQQPSTTVNSVVNDTNLQGSISAQVLTLSFAGALAKSRQHAATVYNDQANSYSSGFLQSFFSGTNFELKDPSASTKKLQFDLSNITASNTRTITAPDANASFVQSVTCTNQFIRSISSQGLPSCASVDNASLVNSSITLQGSTVALGGSALATNSTPQFLRLGLNQAADSSAPLAITGAANNITLFQLKRNTDTSPTGAFTDFQNAAGSSLWKVDITGSLSAGTVPNARVSGLTTSATTDTTNASNITSGTLSSSRLAATMTAINTAPIIFNTSGTQLTNGHIVIGAATLSAGSATVTLSGSAVFTSTATYNCSPVDNSAASAVKFAATSGSQFTLTGTGTDTVVFICVGN